MRAITIDSPDAPPALREDLPDPTPAENEVLVRVHASSANPVDNSIAAGMLAGMGLEHDYPVTLGRDYAGVVERVGEGVSGFSAGDEVFGFLLHANPNVGEGSWADYVVVSEDGSIAPVPDGVDHSSPDRGGVVAAPAAARRRSPAIEPGFHAGRPPRNKAADI